MFLKIICFARLLMGELNQFTFKVIIDERTTVIFPTIHYMLYIFYFLGFFQYFLLLCLINF